MKKAYFSLSLILMLVSITSFAAPSYKINKTEIIVFQPEIPMSGKTKEGSCWTDSLAIHRPGAWRCMIGNEIEDPCFSTRDKNMVVCGANPTQKDSGFILKLKEPLPDTTNASGPIQPWLVQLADGGVCAPYTGTAPFVKGKPIPYGCTYENNKLDKDTHVGLLNIRYSKQVWMATKVTIKDTNAGSHVDKVEAMPVAKAWQ